MRCTLAVAILALFPLAASAQTGNAGVTFSLAYRQYLDVENDSLPGVRLGHVRVWAALARGSGRRAALLE